MASRQLTVKLSRSLLLHTVGMLKIAMLIRSAPSGLFDLETGVEATS